MYACCVCRLDQEHALSNLCIYLRNIIDTIVSGEKDQKRNLNFHIFQICSKRIFFLNMHDQKCNVVSNFSLYLKDIIVMKSSLESLAFSDFIQARSFENMPDGNLPLA